MDVSQYVESLRRELTAAGSTGSPEVAKAAELLIQAIDPAARLGLIEMLSDAADEVTAELAATEYPADVALQIRGREARLTVSPPTFASPPEPPVANAGAPPADADGESFTARFTLRLPEQVKAQVEQAAATVGLSVNAWIVRAVTSWLQSDGSSGSTRTGSGSPYGAWTDWLGLGGGRGNRLRGYTQG